MKINESTLRKLIGRSIKRALNESHGEPESYLGKTIGYIEGYEAEEIADDMGFDSADEAAVYYIKETYAESEEKEQMIPKYRKYIDSIDNKIDVYFDFVYGYYFGIVKETLNEMQWRGPEFDDEGRVCSDSYPFDDSEEEWNKFQYDTPTEEEYPGMPDPYADAPSSEDQWKEYQSFRYYNDADLSKTDNYAVYPHIVQKPDKILDTSPILNYTRTNGYSELYRNDALDPNYTYARNVNTFNGRPSDGNDIKHYSYEEEKLPDDYLRQIGELPIEKDKNYERALKSADSMPLHSKGSLNRNIPSEKGLNEAIKKSLRKVLGRR